MSSCHKCMAVAFAGSRRSAAATELASLEATFQLKIELDALKKSALNPSIPLQIWISKCPVTCNPNRWLRAEAATRIGGSGLPLRLAPKRCRI